MNGRRFSLVVWATLTFSMFLSTAIKAEQVGAKELFELCSVDSTKMSLRVNIVDTDAIRWRRGEIEYKVRNMVESRLRSAGIYSSKVDVPYLFSTLTVFGTEGVAVAVHTRIGYAQLVNDYWGVIGARDVTTWNLSHIGIGQIINDEVFSGVMGIIDIFLVDYLRVNESFECSNLQSRFE